MSIAKRTETEKAAARVIAFYSGCLSATEPALDFFAAYYLDTASMCDHPIRRSKLTPRRRTASSEDSVQGET